MLSITIDLSEVLFTSWIMPSCQTSHLEKWAGASTRTERDCGLLQGCRLRRQIDGLGCCRLRGQPSWNSTSVSLISSFHCSLHVEWERGSLILQASQLRFIWEKDTCMLVLLPPTPIDCQALWRPWALMSWDFSTCSSWNTYHCLLFLFLLFYLLLSSSTLYCSILSFSPIFSFFPFLPLSPSIPFFFPSFFSFILFLLPFPLLSSSLPPSLLSSWFVVFHLFFKISIKILWYSPSTL